MFNMDRINNCRICNKTDSKTFDISKNVRTPHPESPIEHAGRMQVRSTDYPSRRICFKCFEGIREEGTSWHSEKLQREPSPLGRVLGKCSQSKSYREQLEEFRNEARFDFMVAKFERLGRPQLDPPDNIEMTIYEMTNIPQALNSHDSYSNSENVVNRELVEKLYKSGESEGSNDDYLMQAPHNPRITGFSRPFRSYGQRSTMKSFAVRGEAHEDLDEPMDAD